MGVGGAPHHGGVPTTTPREGAGSLGRAVFEEILSLLQNTALWKGPWVVGGRQWLHGVPCDRPRCPHIAAPVGTPPQRCRRTSHRVLGSVQAPDGTDA